MNKKIINSIEQSLYNKVAKRIGAEREKVAASIFETQYKGDPNAQGLAKITPEEDSNPNQKYWDQLENCRKKIAQENPKITKDELQKLAKKCYDEIKEENIPSVIVKRRIAGGMNPQRAKTEKMGYKGKKPGKG